MKWCLFGAFEDKPAVVFPIGDLRDHDPDNAGCWCRLIWDDGVLVHHAMDRREEYERGRKVS